MTGERADWCCPSCDSSDVFRADGDVFQCDRCGLETSEAREATLNRDSDGDPLGVALFLSGGQLDALDVDTAAERVRYWVEDGTLCAQGVRFDG
jgi:hypothetical protein